jgi:hypothetical protein
MNADVLIWGPIGNYYILKGKGSNTGIKQRGWADLEDVELEDAINWCIEEQIAAQGVLNGVYKFVPKIFIYSESMYQPIGTTVKMGKNMGGGGTMYHYMIISDEKIESQEQAEEMVREAIRGPEPAPSGEVLASGSNAELQSQDV